MTSLVNGLINANNIKALNDLLQGYYDDINTFVQANPGTQKAQMLGDILEQLQTNQPLFLDQTHPEQDITYLIAFGSISVAMLAERAYNYELISGGVADENPELARAKLDQAIATLSQAAETAAKKAWEWRLSQITITLAGTNLATDYVLADAYTGYEQRFSEQADAEAAKRKIEEYVGPQYEQQLSGYVSPARLWHYFGTANTEPATPEQAGGPSFPGILFKTKPTQHTVTVTQGGYPTSTHYSEAFQDQLNGGQVTGVMLYSSAENKTGYVTGMQFQYSNQPSGLHGNKGKSEVVVTLDADETIVALYGGSGAYLDQVFFRTSKGRDFGIGGAGGDNFSAAAPQGVGAALSSLQGYAGQQIDGFTMSWQYAVYK
ncbi:jacalin-like lectin [Hymenobacter gummosus]|nr:hypothetical protein [Hymenobacter gummosus]